jgi:hypothetical protein
MLGKAVVDYNAFVDRHGVVIIKEIAVVDVTTKDVQHWVFKAPKDHDLCHGYDEDHSTPYFRNRWLTNHFHGLHIDDGTTAYEDMDMALHMICRHFSTIYAVSDDKCTVLETILNRPVFCLESLGCDRLPRQEILPIPEVPSQCLFHRIYAPGFYCAMTNAVSYANWCADNLDKIDLNRADVREKTFVKWPLQQLTAKTMAENGFVSLHAPDPTATKCVYCSVEMQDWQETDDVLADHEKWSPWCKFIASIKKKCDINLGTLYC